MSHRSPHVFVNDNIIAHASRRGVATYFREVVRGFVHHFGRHATIYSPETGDYGAAEHIRALRFQSTGLTRYRYVHDAMASLVAFYKQPRVFFSPYYGNAWTRSPEVFTVYDTMHELFPQYFQTDTSVIGEFLAEKARCIRRASALIAISHNTAADIATRFPGVDIKKIAVVYPGVGEQFFEHDVPVPRDTEPPFFLYVGHRDKYKNFLSLLIAFSRSDLAKDFRLSVISSRPFSQRETDCIAACRLRDKVDLFIGSSDSFLRQRYRRSFAFVYPSEYEGFGMPILEAMASGTLVATSTTSSMPEVGGDVAFYFDPHSVDSIATTLRHVAGVSAEQRRDRIARGVMRARTFTWQRCQQETIEVLEKLM